MRILGVIALCAVLLASGCAKKSESQLASAALDKGLKAQVAGHSDEAVKDFRETLQHDPNNKFAYYNLGLIDQLAGRTDSAADNYRSALRTDPDYGPALLNLAILLTKSDPNQALKDYQHLVVVEPDNAGGHLNLGFLLKTLGRTDEGNAEIAKAISLDPSLRSRVPQTPNPSPKGK